MHRISAVETQSHLLEQPTLHACVIKFYRFIRAYTRGSEGDRTATPLRSHLNDERACIKSFYAMTTR